MKNRKIILFIVFILGVLGLWLMASFSTYNACAYASSNLEYIKSKIESAVVAQDLKMAKYHAYKALNGIEKTRKNFEDCGCEGTIESLEYALVELKSATKAKTLKASKIDLHRALESTMIGMKVLSVFEQENANAFGNEELALNTNDSLSDPAALFQTDEKEVKKQVHSCLLGFESSLEKVVTDVDCQDARRFIANIHEESRLILLNTGLSPHKKEYHNRVKVLAEEALEKLGDCNP